LRFHLPKLTNENKSSDNTNSNANPSGYEHPSLKWFHRFFNGFLCLLWGGVGVSQ
jgi:hypothetical protein